MDDLVDTETYPLEDLGAPAGQALLRAARDGLARAGMFNLEGFLRPAATRSILADLGPKLATEAFTHARRHNIYFRPHIPGLPPDHPALAEVETVNHTLCADQIGGALDRLYRWPAFRAFLAAALGLPALHEMDDPLARFNVMAYRAGEGLNWHFDRSEFTTTLLLQAPEAGGAFEYRPGLRTAEDPNYDGVARLLRGQDPERRSLTLAPGTLNVFRGRDTAHRVTPVQGGRDRIIAVFSYFERPGVRFSEADSIGFYGRR